MLPAELFPLLLLKFALMASVLGVPVGGLTCLLVRQRWSVKAAVVDAVLASAISLASIFVLSVVYEALESNSTSVLPVALTISTASVAVKHLMPSALRSSTQ
jgi:hypothetical protein